MNNFFDCSFLLHKLLKIPKRPEPLYGLFAEITLVENEQCNLIPDTCSKFDPFLTLPYHYYSNRIRRSNDFVGYYANSYRRQGETGFTFFNPQCRRSCFRF